MKRILLQTVVAMLVATLALAGCRAATIDLQTQSFRDVSGRYHSSEDYGSLGRLTLQIELVKDTHQFKAWLAGIDETTGLSEAFGTYGDGHLVLDFDRGFDSNFFFEGIVEFEGDVILAIDGSFVFADRDDSVPIRFNFVELVL